MMKILLVSATETEIAPFRRFLDNSELPGEMEDRFDILVTGIGCVAATYALTRYLYTGKPDLVIIAGIGGSFRQSFRPEQVLIVREEVMADLGVAEDGLFKDLFDMGFQEPNHFPYYNKRLINPDSWKDFCADEVAGCTINEISTNPERIAEIKKKYDPVIESMEGAAFHYVCIKEGIRFLHLRSISNYVGERNKQNWKLKGSIDMLNRKLIELAMDPGKLRAHNSRQPG